MVHSQEINNNNETTEGLQGKLKDRDYYMSHQSAKTKQLLAAKVGHNVRTKTFMLETTVSCCSKGEILAIGKICYTRTFFFFLASQRTVDKTNGRV